ncbi:hypothetical protein RhiirB3_453582 [Rhizophagus irregularis]|nr:hypothetical protein RhiirB3_453582 [Rhizophagus irregularis]
MVESTNHNDYYYVKQSKDSDVFISPYDDHIVEFTEETMNKLSPMINKLAEKAIQEASEIRSNYYIVNIVTGECPLCLDYIWNRSLRDADWQLSIHTLSNYGVPSKPSAKPRKRNPLQRIYKYQYNFDEFNELESLEDELNIDQMKETCSFCDKILPDPMSDQMKLALDRISSESDWMNFCFIHFAELSELSIISSGIANKYPIINFDELPHHINRFKDDLTEIINVYQKVGHKKAAAPMMLINRFQSLRSGYYRTKGTLLIANTLIDLFITTNILTPINSCSLQTDNYIQEVLVPETAMSKDVSRNSKKCRNTKFLYAVIN